MSRRRRRARKRRSSSGGPNKWLILVQVLVLVGVLVFLFMFRDYLAMSASNMFNSFGTKGDLAVEKKKGDDNDKNAPSLETPSNGEENDAGAEGGEKGTDLPSLKERNRGIQVDPSSSDKK